MKVDAREERESVEAVTKLEGVKVEFCLVEEGKGEGEEQWVEVQEEVIKETGGARDFQVKTGIKRDEKERAKACEVKSLLDDFPNLKVGGLLPDPKIRPEGVVIQETTEWTVVVYP